MSYTLAEKILIINTGLKSVEPGDIIDVNVDIAMAHEACAQVIEPFEKIGVNRVWNRNKIVIPLDHWIPASSETAATLHTMIRKFVKKYRIKHFYDVGNHGICHQMLVENGFVLPGDIVVGTDSHTNTCGALGAFATGIGPTEAAAVFATGKIWFRVPESLKVIVHGKLKFPITANDLSLAILRQIGDDGARYMAVEFTGEGITSMDVASRLTLANMTTEMGAKTGLVPPDKITINYLKKIKLKNGRKLNLKKLSALRADEDANYEKKIEPLVACPPNPANVVPAKTLKNVKVDQVFVGSCTNGRIEDLRIVAKILKGKKISKNVRMLIYPATTKIFRDALNEGLIKIFVESGAIVNAPACAACFGGMGGILGPDEVCLSTSNRNFIGRMGHKTSKVYLCSPVVAAYSALKRYISIQ